jgi:ribosomal protein S18 acetylase RimI-like enzyme
MDNFKFLQDYEQLQYAIMFDRFVDLDFAIISYCQGDDSVFWNHALTGKVLSDGELEKIEKTMKSLDRNPAVYFENKKELQSLVDLLKDKKYKFSFEDSWMFHSGKNIKTNRFDQVSKVTNEKQLMVFLGVFDACYQKGDPQNAYGELGDYLKVAENVWRQHHKTNRLEYFLVYKDGRPVVASTLTNHKGIGYISNVGSLKEVRGRGFGKIATYYCVEQSKKRGNIKHCLATEEGTYANEFYKRIGFVTKLTAVCFTKKD